jgi:hypothetical protein
VTNVGETVTTVTDLAPAEGCLLVQKNDGMVRDPELWLSNYIIYER